MRTFIVSVLTTAALGLFALSPASAENAPWQCMSPAFACGGASTGASHRAYERSYAYDGERSHRRHASGKRKPAHVAKLEKKPKAEAARKEAKVALPERKQAQAKPEHKPQQQAALPAETKTPALEKKPEIAVRKVETEHAYRISSTQSGMASFYGEGAGSRTASGQRFNPSAMTAAHRTLPFGTKVRVTNKRNGKSVVVTINDRGPFIRGRIIDLSTAAAGVIGMRSSGVAPVSVERIATN